MKTYLYLHKYACANHFQAAARSLAFIDWAIAFDARFKLTPAFLPSDRGRRHAWQSRRDASANSNTSASTGTSTSTSTSGCGVFEHECSD